MSPEMNPPLKLILSLLGVFAAGAVFGGFLTLGFQHRKIEQMRLHAPAPMEQFTPQIFKRLSDRLDLTAEQKEKLRPIIRQADKDLRQLRQNGAKEAIAIAERMHEQVAALLTPAQQEKLEQLKREMRDRWLRERQMRWGERPAPSGRPPVDSPRGMEPPPPPPGPVPDESK